MRPIMPGTAVVYRQGAVPFRHLGYHAQNDGGASVDYRLHSEWELWDVWEKWEWGGEQ
jgi:hypothetical protein